MSSRFGKRFGQLRDPHPTGLPWSPKGLTRASGYLEFAAEFSGASFAGGLYRVHDDASGPAAQGWIADAFPNFAARATPFGYDWLGRQFALDSERQLGGEPQVLLLDPATGEVLDSPATFASFHNEELTDFTDDCLALTYFNAWAASSPADVPLGRDTCVGYRVPLFLGGSDELENLEPINLDVYWALSGQLIQAIAELPPGTAISGVSSS